MDRAQTLSPPVSLVPLSRPLMTGEVLDAAFRLFRAGLLRTLPYSGLAVLVLEMPTLLATFASPPQAVANAGRRGAAFVVAHADKSIAFILALLFGVVLFGVITLRLHAISRGVRPRFRREIRAVIRRWPTANLATLGALAFPVMLSGLQVFSSTMQGEIVIFLALVLLWPTAMLVTALPAFWCDGLGPFAAIAKAIRVSCRRSWRMVGVTLATVCMVAVFNVLAALVVGMLSPMFGVADLFLVATISSLLNLVIGAFGVPFVLAVLIVAYEDLKLRDQERRGRGR